MFARYHHYGPLNSHDILKCLAIILMIIDHLGDYIWQDIDAFRLIGRFAMPIFLFLVGYSLSYRWRWNLLAWACVVAVVEIFHFYPVFSLNILFSILVTRFLLRWIDQKFPLNISNLAMIILCCLIWYVPMTMLVDYGTLNVLFALFGYMVAKQQSKKSSMILILPAAVLYVVVQSVDFGFSALHSMVLATGMLLLSWSLMRYRLTNIQWSVPNPLSRTIRFIGRYSLEFYALHLIAFCVISAQLFPGRRLEFVWIDVPGF